MNCHDDQTESSRTESRSVQFQSSLRSVSLDCSTVLDVMEENVKIDQAAQNNSSKCGKNYSEEDVSIIELRENVSAMKTIISEQQKRNMVLGEVVLSLCDQMRYFMERLPASSADEQAAMKAGLRNLVAQLSDGGNQDPAASRVNESSTSGTADDKTRAKGDSTENKINSNLALADVKTNSSIKKNEIGNDMLNGEIRIHNVQEHSNVAHDEVLEIQRVESKENSPNGNVGNVNNCQPLVYHLSEKHGPTGSKTLRINIAPTREQHHPHIARLTKSAFSSSFSTLPNATSTQVKKKSKSRYERTNSLQSLSSSVSLDDLDWPDTDKILEELEVIKERSLSNLAIESNENKMTADKSETTFDAQRGSSNEPRAPDLTAGPGHCPAGPGHCPAEQGHCPAGTGHCLAVAGHCSAGSGHCPAGSGHCPAGSGHCDTVTGPKSPLVDNLPPLENLYRRSEAADLTKSPARHVPNSALPSSDITSDICVEPHGCATVNDVTEANCNEKRLPIDVTKVLQCGSRSSRSTSQRQTSEEIDPQSNLTPAAITQKTCKAPSKRRRRKRLSKSESVSKSGDETEDFVSVNHSSENVLSRSRVKPDAAPSKSDVPIITPRRKAKSKHSSASMSSTNAGYNKSIQSDVSKIDVSNESCTSFSMEERMTLAVREVGKTSSTTRELPKILPSDIDPNCPTSLVQAECNNAARTLERENNQCSPRESNTISTSLEGSEKCSILSTELTSNPSLVEEKTTVNKSSTRGSCTGLRPSTETRSHPSSAKKATNKSSLVTDESCMPSSSSDPITEPSSLGCTIGMESSSYEFINTVASKPGTNSKTSGTDEGVIDFISSTTDVTALGPLLAEDVTASGPLLTEGVTASGPLLTEDVTASGPPLTEDVTAIGPPLTEDVTASGPLLTEDVTASGPPLTEDLTASGPPLTEDVTASGPPLTEDVTVSGPPLTEDVTASGPPLTEDVTASGPPLTEVVTASGPPLTEDVTASCPPLPEDATASGPPLTEVACAASESRGVDAKCGKVSGTCQPSSSDSPELDQHLARPSQFSPEAKEFEPTREYGKAKLLLSPEVSKDARNKTRCPKLTSSCMEQDSYSPPSEEKQGTCAECGTSTSQRCSNCRQVFYCMRDCQRAHWKKGHKNDCKPFKMEKNSTLGRYLVATKDFKAGDIIFKDEPLFVGPKQITEPICLGCYKRVNGSYRCSKCTWPMCGPVCESSPDHQPECVVGKVMGSPIDIQDFSDTNHFYEVVSPLRGLALKKRAPKKYEELLALESHFNDRVGTNVYNENQKRVVNMLKNYFMLVDFPPEDIDASDRSIHQMTGIIDVNTVEIPLEQTEIVGIYPTYSMLEHSCTPNTKYRVSPLYQLTLRAAVNIRQGEHLSTIYTHMLWGTAARRDCLKSTRYFMCTCRRCADPTELGTNFSALRCPKCPLGFMMSAAPLDQLADWICTSCNSTMTADDANDITLQLGEEVETILANARVKDLEDFIERSSATIVHPNHFHLFAARHSLLQMLGREKPGLDEEAVKKKEKMCQEFLKTCTALDPGMCKLSSYAGVALYEYHLAVMARTRQGPTDQQVDKIALKKDLDTAKALLQQCIKVLQEEPSEKPEGQLRNLAEQNLQELSQWESP